MKMKHFKIISEMYPIKFHVILDFKDISVLKKSIKFTKKETITEVHKLIDELDFDNAHGYTFIHKGNIFLMVKEFTGTAGCYDTLMHELTHVINMAAEYIGISYSKDSEEFYAYLQGYLTKRIFLALNF